MTAESRRGIGPSVAWALLGTPILYILLIGPAARLHRDASPPVQRALELTYYPVIWLTQRFDVWPIHRYVEMWEQ